MTDQKNESDDNMEKEEWRFVLTDTKLSTNESTADQMKSHDIISVEIKAENDWSYVLTYDNSDAAMRIRKQYNGDSLNYHPSSRTLGPRDLRGLVHSAVIKNLKSHLKPQTFTAPKFSKSAQPIYVFIDVPYILFQETIEQIKHHLHRRLQQNTL